MYQDNFFNELIIDNFAGGGGASVGIELAIGRPVDIAVNHDADALIEELESCSYDTWSKGVNRTWWAQAVKVKDNIVECIKRQPTADVEEVRHGKIKWVNRPISAQYATVTDGYGEKHYGKVHDPIENNPVGYCGECGKRLDDNFMNYCPNCGAKMDGDRRSE